MLDGVPVDDSRVGDRRHSEAQVAEGEATRRLVDTDRDRIELITTSGDAGGGQADAEAALRAAEAEVAAQTRELAARRAAAQERQDVLTLEQDTLRQVVGSVFTSKAVDTMMGVGTFDQMTAGQRRQDVRNRTVDIQSGIVEERDKAWRTARGAVAAQQRRLGRSNDAETTGPPT